MAAVATATPRPITLGRRNGALSLMRALVGVGMQREAAPVAAALVLELDELVRERNGSGSAYDSGLSSGNSRSSLTSGTTYQPTGATMSTATTALSLVELAEKIAKASKLKNLSVESRQNDKVAVILLQDGDAQRLLAYVRHGRKDTISLEVAHWGAYTRVACADLKAAAEALKTSERRTAKKPATATA